MLFFFGITVMLFASLRMRIRILDYRESSMSRFDLLSELTMSLAFTMLGLHIALLYWSEALPGTIIRSSTFFVFALFLLAFLMLWEKHIPKNFLSLFKDRILFACQQFGTSFKHAKGPHGWSELTISGTRPARAFSLRSFIASYSAGLIISGLAGAILLAVHFEQSVDVHGIIMRAKLGYNLLFVATAVTVSAALLALIALLLKQINFFQFQLDIRGAAIYVATCVGYATAAGVLAVALTPVLLYMSALNEPEPTSAFSLTPSIIFSLPAVSATFGYISGMITFSFKLWSNVHNLFYRCLILPLGSLCGLWVTLFHLGFTPEKLFSTIVLPHVNPTALKNFPCATLTHSTLSFPRNDDAAWLVSALHTCKSHVFISGETIFTIIATTVSIFAVIFLVSQIAKRSQSDSVGFAR